MSSFVIALTIGALAVLLQPSTVLAQGLDHFTCYKTAATKGALKFAPVAGVTVVDQFRASTVEVNRPKRLCAPTNKSGEDPSAPWHADHRDDYQVKAAKFPHVPTEL